MKDKNISDKQQSRADIRRQQVMDAAAECFRRHGFHGASIAQISETAGMSAGHIYHFFENKEAIISAIIERNLELSIEKANRIRMEGDIFQALIDKADEVLEMKTDPAFAALDLEIMAEAARNPRVAAMVQAADAVRRKIFGDLHVSARRARGLESAEHLTGAIEVAMSLLDGLSVRSISHPQFDQDKVLPVLQNALRAILES